MSNSKCFFSNGSEFTNQIDFNFFYVGFLRLAMCGKPRGNAPRFSYITGSHFLTKVISSPKESMMTSVFTSLKLNSLSNTSSSVKISLFTYVTNR